MRSLIIICFSILLACVSQKQRGPSPPSQMPVSPTSGNVAPRLVRLLLYRDVQKQAQTNFQSVLQQRLRRDVRITTVAERDLINVAARGEFELAFIPPLVYSKIRQYATPILQARINNNWYTNTLMAFRKEEQLTNIRQIEGKRLLFGPTLSLHSYVWPISQLIYRKINLNKAAHYSSLDISDLDSLDRLMNRQVDVVFVASPSVDWGRGGDKSFRKEGISFLPLGPPIPTDLVAVRTGIEDSFEQLLREQLITLSQDPSQSAFFLQLGWERLRETDKDVYQIVIDADNFLSDYLGQSYSLDN